jgi:hypothetical protein
MLQRKNARSSRFKPATPEQLAEIERLGKLISIYGAEINQPHIHAWTIITTTILFSFLAHQQYLKRLDDYFDNFLPYELTNENANEAQTSTAHSIELVLEGCLHYYDTSQTDIETFLRMRHGNHNVDTIRDNCLIFCQNFIKATELSKYQVEMIIGFAIPLHKLGLQQLFEATSKLVPFADAFAEEFSHQVSLEKHSAVLNIIKGIFITVSDFFIIKPFINFISPYGIWQSHKPRLIQDRQHLNERDAKNYLTKLEKYSNKLKGVAHRNTILTRITFGVLTLLMLVVLLNSDFVSLPGELSFILIASFVTALHLGFRYTIKKIDGYYLYSRVNKLKEILDTYFSEYFIISIYKASSIELVQFSFNYSKEYKDISAEDMEIVLSRCLENHGIGIISSNPWHVAIPYSKKITLALIKQVKIQFISCVNRLVKINALTKELLEIQKILIAANSTEHFVCNKFFNDRGFPSVTWYLSSYSEKQSMRLRELFGENNCTLQQADSDRMIIIVRNIEYLDKLNLTDYIKKMELEVLRVGEDDTDQFYDNIFLQSNQSTHRKHKKPLKTIQMSEEKDKKEQKSVPKTEIEKLPPPFEKAKRIKAPFLPKDAHVWACFFAKKEDFPTDDCYKSFKGLFKEPTVVAHVNKEGLVQDAKRSTPEDQRLKAKLLGKYNAIRLLGNKVYEVNVSKKVEKVHVFSKVIYEHT